MKKKTDFLVLVFLLMLLLLTFSLCNTKRVSAALHIGNYDGKNYYFPYSGALNSEISDAMKSDNPYLKNCTGSNMRITGFNVWKYYGNDYSFVKTIKFTNDSTSDYSTGNYFNVDSLKDYNSSSYYLEPLYTSSASQCSGVSNVIEKLYFHKLEFSFTIYKIYYRTVYTSNKDIMVSENGTYAVVEKVTYSLTLGYLNYNDPSMTFTKWTLNDAKVPHVYGTAFRSDLFDGKFGDYPVASLEYFKYGETNKDRILIPAMIFEQGTSKSSGVLKGSNYSYETSVVYSRQNKVSTVGDSQYISKKILYLDHVDGRDSRRANQIYSSYENGRLNGNKGSYNSAFTAKVDGQVIRGMVKDYNGWSEFWGSRDYGYHLCGRRPGDKYFQWNFSDMGYDLADDSEYFTIFSNSSNIYLDNMKPTIRIYDTASNTLIGTVVDGKFKKEIDSSVITFYNIKSNKTYYIFKDAITLIMGDDAYYKTMSLVSTNTFTTSQYYNKNGYTIKDYQSDSSILTLRNIIDDRAISIGGEVVPPQSSGNTSNTTNVTSYTFDYDPGNQQSKIYEILIKDLFDKDNAINFIIDKKAPALTMNDISLISDYKYHKVGTDIYVSAHDYNEIIALDDLMSVISIKKEDDIFEKAYIETISNIYNGTNFRKFIIKLKDKVGNESREVTFYLRVGSELDVNLYDAVNSLSLSKTSTLSAPIRYAFDSQKTFSVKYDNVNSNGISNATILVNDDTYFSCINISTCKGIKGKQISLTKSDFVQTIEFSYTDYFGETVYQNYYIKVEGVNPLSIEMYDKEGAILNERYTAGFVIIVNKEHGTITGIERVSYKIGSGEEVVVDIPSSWSNNESYIENPGDDGFYKMIIGTSVVKLLGSEDNTDNLIEAYKELLNMYEGQKVTVSLTAQIGNATAYFSSEYTLKYKAFNEFDDFEFEFMNDEYKGTLKTGYYDIESTSDNYQYEERLKFNSIYVAPVYYGQIVDENIESLKYFDFSGKQINELFSNKDEAKVINFFILDPDGEYSYKGTSFKSVFAVNYERPIDKYNIDLSIDKMEGSKWSDSSTGKRDIVHIDIENIAYNIMEDYGYSYILVINFYGIDKTSGKYVEILMNETEGNSEIPGRKGALTSNNDIVANTDSVNKNITHFTYTIPHFVVKNSETGKMEPNFKIVDNNNYDLYLDRFFITVSVDIADFSMKVAASENIDFNPYLYDDKYYYRAESIYYKNYISEVVKTFKYNPEHPETDPIGVIYYDELAPIISYAISSTTEKDEFEFKITLDDSSENMKSISLYSSNGDTLPEEAKLFEATSTNGGAIDVTSLSFTDTGVYTVVTEDKFGNRNTQTFTIQRDVNGNLSSPEIMSSINEQAEVDVEEEDEEESIIASVIAALVVYLVIIPTILAAIAGLIYVLVVYVIPFLTKVKKVADTAKKAAAVAKAATSKDPNAKIAAAKTIAGAAGAKTSSKK